MSTHPRGPGRAAKSPEEATVCIHSAILGGHMSPLPTGLEGNSGHGQAGEGSKAGTIGAGDRMPQPH